MAALAQARRLQSVAARGHRTAVFEPAEQGKAAGRLRLRRLRPAIILIQDEIRKWHRLAELLSGAAKCSGDAVGPLAADRSHRSALPPLRRSSRSCVRGWPAADGL